jgi:endonuclease YncB( thermonuclease family)
MPRITVSSRPRTVCGSIFGVGLAVALCALLLPGLAHAQQQPATPAPATPAPATPAPATPAPATPAPATPAPGTVSGTVTQVPNSATVVIGETRLRLAGVDPGPEDVLAPIEGWLLHQAGALQCQPAGQTGRYICRAADGADIAGTIIRNGAARVGLGAPADYRNFENEARENHRGLWKEP